MAKKFIACLLATLLFTAPLYADSSFVAPSATGQATTGQIPGTTTNDDATAGNVGQSLVGIAQGTNATVTVTIASPAVVTWTAHGYSNTGVGIFVATTTGALPTGIVANTTYYTIPGTVTANTFQLAASVANAFAGTAINTSGTQSGTHTGLSKVAAANNTAIVAAAIQLTAGDWEVNSLQGHVSANTAVVTALASVASTTIGGDFFAQSTAELNVTLPSTGTTNTTTVPPFRVSVANGATQIMYLVAFDSFTVAGLTTYGKISARRVR